MTPQTIHSYHQSYKETADWCMQELERQSSAYSRIRNRLAKHPRLSEWEPAIKDAVSQRDRLQKMFERADKKGTEGQQVTAVYALRQSLIRFAQLLTELTRLVES